jgi:DNA-binding beta-propeller fold protein YncE
MELFEDMKILNAAGLTRLAAACGALYCLFGAAPAFSAPVLPPGIVPGVQNHTITMIASTVPSNGDVNPYGVAVVPATTGSLVRGDILVSNFNDAQNLQGTGTTIVQISPSGRMSLFAQVDAKSLPGACPGGVGLTTALFVTRTGWVFVGSLPTKDGMSDTAHAGCIVVLNSLGQAVETFWGSLVNGPWDMTGLDAGTHVGLWFTNVLNGTVAGNGHIVHGGTVVRLDLNIPFESRPRIASATVIGSGFPERTDPAALVIGPTGVALSANGKFLYLADSLNNRIAAIPNPLFRTTSAGVGDTVTTGGALNDPLGMAIAPNGDILTVNGNDGYLVWTTPRGTQVRKDLLDSNGNPPGAGALFGLAVVPEHGLYFVDDVTNTLNLFAR